MATLHLLNPNGWPEPIRALTPEVPLGDIGFDWRGDVVIALKPGWAEIRLTYDETAALYQLFAGKPDAPPG